MMETVKKRKEIIREILFKDKTLKSTYSMKVLKDAIGTKDRAVVEKIIEEIFRDAIPLSCEIKISCEIKTKDRRTIYFPNGTLSQVEFKGKHGNGGIVNVYRSIKRG